MPAEGQSLLLIGADSLSPLPRPFALTCAFRRVSTAAHETDNGLLRRIYGHRIGYEVG